MTPAFGHVLSRAVEEPLDSDIALLELEDRIFLSTDPKHLPTHEAIVRRPWHEPRRKHSPPSEQWWLLQCRLRRYRHAMAVE
jgi:hypothetical protein